MRTTPFPNTIMRAIKVKRPRKVYDVNDVFPYGSWIGQKLSVVVAFAPLLVEKWITKNHISITPQLKEMIDHHKYLAQ